MLFTLILLQARHLSLGVLGAVGFTPLDYLLYTLLMLRGESRVKADPADPIQPVASPVSHSPSHSRAPAVCTGLSQCRVCNAGWFSSFLEN